MNHHVCVTFDFDTASVAISQGQTSPTPVSGGEFGAIASGRILALLERLGIRSTWFVPGFTAVTYPREVEAVAAAGHEIGNHGWAHIAPAALSPEEEERELVRANDDLEALLGIRPRGFRSPSWDLSPVSIELLERHGMVYDSSLMGNDLTPYRARTGDRVALGEPLGFGRTTDIVELPISWTLDDWAYLGFQPGQSALMPAPLFENALGDFTWLKQNLDWGVVTITFHPFVIGRGHRLLALERFLTAVQESGATFSTCTEVVQAWLVRA